MTNLQNLTVEQLRRVVAIKEQIGHLEAVLDKISRGGSRRGRPPADGVARLGRPRGRRLSAAAKARIAAGQRARWAKIKGRTAAPANGRKRKRRVSAATKARLAAVARARWAKAKAAGKSAL
jgi:hypothetical protein